MNKVEVDGCVQKDVKLFDEIASFNISILSGFYNCPDNTRKKRYTFYRVIFPVEITPQLEEIIQPKSMIRIYGELDSDTYITTTGKYVYNKIIRAKRVVRIRYNKATKDYEEVEIT